MAKFKRGEKVTQIVNPVVGSVTGFSVDQETGETQVKVEWSDAEGDHSRFFVETDLMPTPETEASN